MNIPLNIDWQQILLHLFNFSILAGGLYLLLYRPIQDFMKKREEHYREVDRQAEEAKAQADRLQQEYQEKLSSADAELAQKRSQVQKGAGPVSGPAAGRLPGARRTASWSRPGPAPGRSTTKCSPAPPGSWPTWR